MEQYDIIGAIKAYAESMKWHFIYGADSMLNYEAGNIDFAVGDLVLGATYVAKPTITNGRATDIEYDMLMTLGRKVDDDGTRADIDETLMQKHEARLKELVQMLSNAIGQIACNNELDVENVRIEVRINQTDENIDMAYATLTYIQ